MSAGASQSLGRIASSYFDNGFLPKFSGTMRYRPCFLSQFPIEKATPGGPANDKA